MSSTTQILKAEPVTQKIYARLESEISDFKIKTKHTPTLATVLIGEDPASEVYVRNKGKMCVKLGMGHKDFKLSPTTTQKEFLTLIDTLNNDNEIDGILVQQPMPKHLDAKELFDKISPLKDVDCFNPHNVGLLVQNRCPFPPCTPQGVMEILKYYGISIAGKNSLVIGRSDIVGKPMSFLLLHGNATVVMAHSQTKDIASHIANADIVVAAIGKLEFLKTGLPWKKTSVVIDVGINRRADGKLGGDVEFSGVVDQVSAITPVPGGVGPLTIAMLMQNTLMAARIRS